MNEIAYRDPLDDDEWRLLFSSCWLIHNKTTKTSNNNIWGAFFKSVFLPFGVVQVLWPIFLHKKSQWEERWLIFFLLFFNYFSNSNSSRQRFLLLLFFKRMSFPLFFIISNYTCPLLLLLQGANKKKSFLTCRWALLVDGQVWGDWINLLLLLLLLPLVA